MPNKILVINGPNLNLLGEREPGIYGKFTLKDIQHLCEERAKLCKLTVDFCQSNEEGVLVDWIQKARKSHKGIIINAGAYTHTSVAIRDALLSVKVPVIEVHISNIFKRETFRHTSFISDIAEGMICGLGPQGYVLAIEAMHQLLAAAK